MISIPNGPSELAITEAAWGLARYAAISQVLYVPLVCAVFEGYGFLLVVYMVRILSIKYLYSY